MRVYGKIRSQKNFKRATLDKADIWHGMIPSSLKGEFKPVYT
jgi:hypothetical protein